MERGGTEAPVGRGHQRGRRGLHAGAARSRELDRAKAATKRSVFEWRMRHRSGRKAWHEVRIKPAMIAGKQRLLAYTRDITDRKAAEEALRTSESQYRAIFEASQDGLALGDDEGRLVDVNPAFLRLVGATRDEVVGRDGLRFILPSMREESEARFERAIARRARPRGGAGGAHRRDRGRRRDPRRADALPRPAARARGRARPDRAQARRACAARQRGAVPRDLQRGRRRADPVGLADYRRVDVNAAYERIYGWSRDEVSAGPTSSPAFAPEYARLRLELCGARSPARPRVPSSRRSARTASAS